MKKILIILVLTLILSACTKPVDPVDPVDPLEGRSEQEIAACYLVQEFVVFSNPDTTDVAWVTCNFEDATQYFPNDNRWVAISPKPSELHPNYENYLRNKKFREENNMEAPPSTLLIDTENQLIMDPNLKDPQAGKFMKKVEDKFTRPSEEELIELYGEEILEIE